MSAFTSFARGLVGSRIRIGGGVSTGDASKFSPEEIALEKRGFHGIFMALFELTYCLQMRVHMDLEGMDRDYLPRTSYNATYNLFGFARLEEIAWEYGTLQGPSVNTRCRYFEHHTGDTCEHHSLGILHEKPLAKDIRCIKHGDRNIFIRAKPPTAPIEELEGPGDSVAGVGRKPFPVPSRQNGFSRALNEVRIGTKAPENLLRDLVVAAYDQYLKNLKEYADNPLKYDILTKPANVPPYYDKLLGFIEDIAAAEQSDIVTLLVRIASLPEVEEDTCGYKPHPRSKPCKNNTVFGLPRCIDHANVGLEEYVNIKRVVIINTFTYAGFIANHPSKTCREWYWPLWTNIAPEKLYEDYKYEFEVPKTRLVEDYDIAEADVEVVERALKLLRMFCGGEDYPYSWYGSCGFTVKFNLPYIFPRNPEERDNYNQMRRAWKDWLKKEMHAQRTLVYNDLFARHPQRMTLLVPPEEGGAFAGGDDMDIDGGGDGAGTSAQHAAAGRGVKRTAAMKDFEDKAKYYDQYKMGKIQDPEGKKKAQDWMCRLKPKLKKSKGFKNDDDDKFRKSVLTGYPWWKRIVEEDLPEFKDNLL